MKNNYLKFSRLFWIVFFISIYTTTHAQYTVNTIVRPADPIGGVVNGADGTFSSGQTVTLTAVPNQGYEFYRWKVGSEYYTENPYSFTITDNITVRAYFNEVVTNYTVSVVNGTPGSEQYVTISGAGQKVQGEAFTLSATYSYPYNGCHWYLNGQKVSGGDSYTYTNNGDGIQSDLEFTVYFDYIPQNRTISVASNNPSRGTVQIEDYEHNTSTSSLTIIEGTQVTLTATPTSNASRFSGWFLNDQLVSSNDTYTFTLPNGSGDRTYTANFVESTDQFTMTAVYEPSEAASTKVPNPSTSILVGNEFTFSTSATTNWTFDGWYDEDNQLLTTDGSYTISVIRDRTLTAKFHHDPYTITATANPSIAGSVDIQGANNQGTYDAGSSPRLTATANTGYRFTNWSGDFSSTTNPYTINNISRNYNAIVANFIATHTITLTNATLTNASTTPHDGRYDHNTSYTVTANERANHVFSHWVVNGVDEPNANVNPYTGTLTDDVTLEPVYTPVYTVTLSKNPANAVVTLTGNGSYTSGSQVTVEASYDHNSYNFLRWTVTGTPTVVSTQNPYTFDIDGSIELTAQMEALTHYYTVTTSIVGLGSIRSDNLSTIPGSSTVAEGNTVVIDYDDVPGWHFQKWVVNGVDNTNATCRIENISADVTVQAVFTESSVHHVTVNNNLNDPNIIVSGLNDGGVYNDGDRLELFAYVQGNNPNYQFVGWFEGTTLLGTNPTFIIDPVERDYNLTVYFFASVNPDQEDYLIYNDPDLRTQVLGVIEGYRNRITTVTIPASVTSIADGAFRNCTALTSVTVPANVESLGSYVFDNCSALTTVNLHNGLTLGDYAFNNCTALQAVTLPADLTAIPEGLFKGCTSLQNVVLPAGVTSIGSYAYNGCSSIYTLDLPGTVVTVGAQAFSRMEGLRFVTLNGGTQSFGNDCFNFSNAIVSTTFNGTLEQWLAIDFANANAQPMSRSRNLFLNGQMLTDVVIPDGTTEVKAFAFFYDTLITRVTIPATVTRIDSMAFYRLTNLERIVLQGMPATVHTDAFRSVDKENVIVEVPCNDYTADMTWEGFSHVISAGMPAFNIVQRPGGVVTITSAPTCNSIAYTYTISATPGAYNMFQSWSDGNTDNPRTLTITEDVTLSPIWNRSPDARVTMNPYFTFDVPEDEASWYGANNGANQWVIGSAAHFNRTGKGLYVTNDGGTTNAYDASSSPYVYTEFNLAAGFYRMGFNYRVAGEKDDFLSVALFPEDGSYPDVTPHTDGGIILYDSLYNVDEWDAKERIIEIAEGHEGWYRLVFFWTADDDDNIVNPAAAVDNVYASYVQPSVLQGSWARVTVSSNDEDMGSAYTCLGDNGEHKLTDLYYFGEDIQIHAVPTDANYRFVRWSDGSREAHRHFNFVDIYGTTTNLTAFFEPVPDHYNVTVDIEAGASNGALQFGVEVNGEYLHYAQIPNGQNATVKLNLPQDGWAFMGWWNGTDTIHANPYTYTAGTDITLIALMKEWQPCDGSGINGNFDFSSSVPRGDNFEYRFPALDDVTVSNVNIYVNQHQIVVEEANGVEVKLFDVNGRLLSTLKDNVMPLRIDVPASGSYMVQVGNLLTKKVVVIK